MGVFTSIPPSLKSLSLIHPPLPLHSGTSIKSPNHLYLCLTSPPSIPHHFRRLNAHEAAELAQKKSADLLPPSTWPSLIDLLYASNITGPTLSRLVRRLGVHELVSLNPNLTKQTLYLLDSRLRLSLSKRNRVVTVRPDLLSNPSAVDSTLDAFRTVLDLSMADVRTIVVRWPGLLVLGGQVVTRAVRFLTGPYVGVSMTNLRALIRRAPWVLVYDVEMDMVPAVAQLRRILDMEWYEGGSLESVIRSAPLLLGISRQEVGDMVEFFRTEIGFRESDVAGTVRMFPVILTANAEMDLKPRLCFLMKELGLSTGEIRKMVRAFPAVLMLDVEQDMRQIVEYFKSKGVQNVGRLIYRLPPLLGYDLETEIVPKMEYLEHDLKLGIFEVLQFPAYFSYSLDRRIIPRTKFTLATRNSVRALGLNNVLTLSDDLFCERVLRCRPELFKEFQDNETSKKDLSKQAGPRSPVFGSYEGDLGKNKGLKENGIAPQSKSTMTKDKKQRRRYNVTLSRIPWQELW